MDEQTYRKAGRFTAVQRAAYEVIEALPSVALRGRAWATTKHGISPDLRTRFFHFLYDMPIARHFTLLNRKRLKLRLDLILEEVSELVKASGCMIETDHDVENPYIYQPTTVIQNPIEIADALGDIVYVCYGMALEMGIDLDLVIREIHLSNLTKLAANGSVIRREDGKILKGPNYQRVDLQAILGPVIDFQSEDES